MDTRKYLSLTDSNIQASSYNSQITQQYRTQEHSTLRTGAETDLPNNIKRNAMIIAIKNPIREMYDKFKTEYRNTIMLVENNDEYTAYYQDTKPISDILEFEEHDGPQPNSVTFKRNYLDIVLPLLVKKGYKIAICKIQKQI